MVIKYYENGWNYIDNVTNVKWLNKQIVYSGIASCSGDIKISEDDKRELSYIIIEQVEEQLNNQNNEYYSKLLMRVEDSIYDIIRSRKEQPYIRVLCFDTGEIRNCLIFTGRCYLLNDSGKTIESL